MLKTNLDRLNLQDLEVQARVTLYRSVPTIVWVTGTVRHEVDQKDVTDDMVIPSSCWEGQRATETLSMDLGSGAISQWLVRDMSPTYEFAREGGWQHPFRLELFEGDTQIGFISDNHFHFTAAESLRQYIGWIWASGLGRRKEITRDLDAAVEQVAQHVHYFAGAGDYESWSSLMGRVYVRDETVPYEHYPYLNGTLFVATRTLLGVAHKGFNICY
jgi:hypothetical protein